MKTSENNPVATNTNEYRCRICQKTFKNKAGLPRHDTIIRKYNTRQVGLPTVSKKLTKLFINDLVYFIHRRLPNGFKNSGKKTVSIPCSESQFHAVLGDIYIFILKSLVLISVGFVKRKERKN